MVGPRLGQGVGMDREAPALSARDGPQATAAGAAVQLDAVSKHFGGFVAVDRMSLVIEPGEFITFLGPSGSGKTTSLMMLAGFETPSAGEILIDGHAMSRVPPYRRNVGMVFQSYALFPHMSVAENIGFPLRQRRIPRSTIARRVAETLDLVQMAGYGARAPGQLSGGQQQRVAIARAIIFRPRVLLMDEPLSALDKKLREDMQFEIKRLHERLGITFVYVTHDQREALVMSDRVAVMNEGRIEQLGAPAEIYDRPANHFVASFIGESNFIAGVPAESQPGEVALLVGEAVLRGLGAGGTRLMVRPEKITLHRPGNASVSGNALPAIVREVTFVGEVRRYLTTAADGTPITAKAPHRFGMENHAPGDAVVLCWAVEDTRAV